MTNWLQRFGSEAKEKGTLFSLLSLTFPLAILSSLISISATQIFLFLSFIFWLVALVQKKRRPLFPPFCWPLGAYVALSLLSSFFSVDPGLSLKDSRELLLFLIVPITLAALSTKSDLDRTLCALLASGLASIVYSLFTFLKASPGERIRGFMGHYMTQAGLLLLLASLSLSLFFFLKTKTRFLWGLAFCLSLFGLGLTLTRSAWIGLLIAICFLLLIYDARLLAIVPVALALFFILSPQPMKKRALSIFSSRALSNQLRLEYLRAGAQIIKEYPLLGTGPDTVDLVFQSPKYNLSHEARRNVHLHNNFIQIAAERGVPTLIAWLTFLGWAFASLFKLLRTSAPPGELRALAAAALAAILALVSAGFFEYNFGDSEITTVFLFIITVPFTLKKEKRD